MEMNCVWSLLLRAHGVVHTWNSKRCNNRNTEKFYLGVIIKVYQRKESFIKFPSYEEDSRCRHPGNCQTLWAGSRMYMVGWTVLPMGGFIVNIRTYS